MDDSFDFIEIGKVVYLNGYTFYIELQQCYINRFVFLYNIILATINQQFNKQCYSDPALLRVYLCDYS